MKEKFLELGFKEIGEFKSLTLKLDLERIYENYNPSNIVWTVLTDEEILYIGETINSINEVIKDLENGNINRDTRNKIHLLITEHILKNRIYLFVDESGINTKEDLIRQFQPFGNNHKK
ncbi:hypothetical protein [Chryseobacterium sp. MYb328]|uniref:hypothetical protein n=1 Tax=Chryseobacterium sp. MYb328 TaxID=2745231 RepID=UPI00309AC81E